MRFAGLTNAVVARDADVSIKKVEDISAGNTAHDIIRANARRIELVVLGPVGRHHCKVQNDVHAEQVAQLKAEVEYWKKENDRKAKIIDKYLDS